MTKYWFWPHCASYCCSTTSMRCMIPLEIMEIPLQFHFFLFELRRKRLTSRRITSYKKYRALPTQVFTVWQLLRTSLSDLWSPFFSLTFWGLGPNFKRDGKRYLLWEKLDLILHMIACGLIRFEFDSVTYFNKFLAWHWTCKIRFKRMPGKAAFWGSLRPF